jgi:transcription elongation GreA/GreB family factor
LQVFSNVPFGSAPPKLGPPGANVPGARAGHATTVIGQERRSVSAITRAGELSPVDDRYQKKLQDEIGLSMSCTWNCLRRSEGEGPRDPSENAEYHAAKDRQGFVNARLGQLRKRIPDGDDRLQQDSRGRSVSGRRWCWTPTRTELTYHLVTSEEAAPANGKISTTSPIGRALLGMKSGTLSKCRARRLGAGDSKLTIRRRR